MRGFGFIFDVETGRMRSWYAAADGVRCWVDNHQPVDPTPQQTDEKEST